MEEQNIEKETNFHEKLKNDTEKLICKILEEGIQYENVDILGKLVDIHKDIANEEYWLEKEEIMRYRNYGEYGEYGNDNYGRRSRDSRGRYTEGSYGRRGVKGTGRGRYRGEEMLDDMMYHYGNYSEGVENYGGDSESDKSFDKMLECLETFIYTVMEEADEPMKKEKIKKVARKVMEM